MKAINNKEQIRNDLSFFLKEKIQSAMAKSSAKIGWRKFNSADFKIVNVGVDIPELPVAFDSYRIVHISDIHYGQWISAERMNGVVGMINQQEPDLVAITGDFVSYSGDNVDELAHILGKLNPKDASVAVLGNHDHWLSANLVRSVLRDSHIIELDNDIYSVKKHETALCFAGVDSTTLKRDRLEEVLKKMPPQSLAILLCHEPDFADISAATRRFALQLSGHSHGGQFIIPKFGTPIRGRNFMKYPLGLYKIEDMLQYTNRGIGTNAFWVRLNCAPEVTVIDLHAS